MSQDYSAYAVYVDERMDGRLLYSETVACDKAAARSRRHKLVEVKGVLPSGRTERVVATWCDGKRVS